MIHIAYTINCGYVKYCGVAMLSAARSAPGQRFSFHVIANDLTQADREFLSKLGAKENAKVSFYAVPDELASRYKVTWDANRLPLLVYYRCFLASLLPKDVEKVIYMDCDTLVLHSLQELWETPLESKAIAACRDEVQFKPERAERLMYDASYGYFNGGVLLINLKYWREHHVEEALREFYQKYPERIVYNDQDLLNAVLYDKKVMVSLRWNVQGMFYKRKLVLGKHYEAEHLDAALHPYVVHYTSRHKPWHLYCVHPYKEECRKYLQEVTPETIEAMRKPMARLRRYLHLLPYYLRLKPWKYMSKEEMRELSRQKRFRLLQD